MNLRVAVDFGTSSTCVVASVNGREPQVVVIDGHPLLPSAVYAGPDGTLFVGQEAERQAAVDPSRYEPHPKRRIDEGELLLGSTVLPVRDVIHAVLRRAVAEARRFAGGAEVGLLVLTHPAGWGVVRTRTLRQAAAGLAREVSLVPEPVAAAVFHSAPFAPQRTGSERTVEFSGQVGDVLAVLDVGGGTVDVSVVRREDGPGGQAGFRVLATKGDPSFGGADVDQVLLEHVGSMVAAADVEAWRGLMEGRELADRRRRRVLRQDVRGAKETLSRHAYTDVPMPPPFADAHVTRDGLERLIAEPLGRAVALTAAAIEEAGLRPQQLTGIFLVGGSSRIPMIARLVHERLGIVPTTLDQPETVVARGAMRAVLAGARRPVPVRPAGPPPRRAVLPASAAGPTQRIAAPVPEVLAASGTSGSKGKFAWLIGGAVVVVAAVVVGLVLLLNQPEPKAGPRKPSAVAGEQAVEAFSYRFEYPDDWVQTDMLQQEKQVAVRPSSARDGSDFVSVQQFDLSYDGEAERQRFLRELRDGLNAQEQKYERFTADATFAGRSVIQYVEPGEESAVVWLVLVERRVQISVGCQFTAAGRDKVEPACEQVVRSLRIEG